MERQYFKYFLSTLMKIRVSFPDLVVETRCAKCRQRSSARTYRTTFQIVCLHSEQGLNPFIPVYLHWTVCKVTFFAYHPVTLFTYSNILLAGLTQLNEYPEQVELLRKIWFTKYARHWTGLCKCSCAFENIFMAELKSNDVLGMFIHFIQWTQDWLS